MIEKAPRPAGSVQLGLRETVVAALGLMLILGLSVANHYIQGQGLYLQVIWDPVGLYIFYPGDHVAIQAFKEGFFPLWDSTRGMGTPHVMPILGSADFPLKVLAYLMNSGAGWELYILLRLWLAGVFCFMAAREMPLGFRGSFFAGLSFMLCGYFREFQNLPDINVALTFPLLLFFLTRLARNRSILSFLATAVLFQFLDNHPQSALYAHAFLSLFYTAACILAGKSRGRLHRETAGLVLLYPLIVIFGVLLDCDSLVPFMEYFFSSWSFHPPDLGLIYIPINYAIGLVTPVFDFWMPGVPGLAEQNLLQLTVVPSYLGTVVCILAGLALVRPQRLPPMGLATAGIGLLAAGVIFGVPPFSLLSRLPVIRSLQNFRYLQPYLAFAAALLAGTGLELLARDSASTKRALAVAAAIAAWVAVHAFMFRAEVLGSKLILIGIAALVAGAALVFTLAAALMKKCPGRRRKIMAWALIAASAFELCLYFSLARPLFGPDAFKSHAPPWTEEIKHGPGNLYRIYGAGQRILHPNLAGMYGLSDLRDYSPLYVRDYVRMMARINGWESEGEIRAEFLEDGKFYFDLDLGEAPAGVLDALNVRYVISREVPEEKPLSGEVKIHENKDFFPRVFSTAAAKACDEQEQCLSGLVSEDPGHAVMVAGISCDKGGLSRPRITEIREGHDRLSFRASSRGTALAVISNLYFPGWRAYVDGRETRVLRVNGVMQGVFLGPGRRRVELVYHPLSFKLGLWMQVIWLPLVIIVLSAALKRSSGRK